MQIKLFSSLTKHLMIVVACVRTSGKRLRTGKEAIHFTSVACTDSYGHFCSPSPPVSLLSPTSLCHLIRPTINPMPKEILNFFLVKKEKKTVSLFYVPFFSSAHCVVKHMVAKFPQCLKICKTHTANCMSSIYNT